MLEFTSIKNTKHYTYCVRQGRKMSKAYMPRCLCGGQFIAITAMLLCAVAHAQPSALLEACNSVEDKDKRLACFKELSNLNSSGTTDAAAGKRVKNAFAAIAGAVNSGVSFANYSAMILEPAKEIGIFKQEIQKPDQRVLDLFDQSLVSYRDAEKVWHASIYDSSDGGLFLGRVLNPNYIPGLQDIVRKYNLPTRRILLAEHLPVDTALPIIWRYAEERAKAAVEMLEGRSTGEAKVDASTSGSPPAPGQGSGQFQWPAMGAVIAGYDGVKNRGLDIDGKAGDPVSSAADGVVVFADSGLHGFGNLIIIKHDNTYLTAYAHNETLLAKPGEKVSKGQRIANMGSTESDRVKLHFEIRRNGQAIDPTPYLPANLQSSGQPSPGVDPSTN
jgi:hypothetical protein